MTARPAFGPPCANGFPGCGFAAPGYNPLGLCAGCLAKYRAACSSPIPVGGGAPAPLVRVRPCPLGCSGGPCKAASVVRRGDWIHITLRPGACARASL